MFPEVRIIQRVHCRLYQYIRAPLYSTSVNDPELASVCLWVCNLVAKMYQDRSQGEILLTEFSGSELQIVYLFSSKELYLQNTTFSQLQCLLHDSVPGWTEAFILSQITLTQVYANLEYWHVKFKNKIPQFVDLIGRQITSSCVKLVIQHQYLTMLKKYLSIYI